MEIKVRFTQRNPAWEALVLQSAQVAARILHHPEFLARVRSAPAFTCTDSTPAQVAERIQQQETVQLVVGFYWNWFGWAIAKEENGGVRFNTAKRRQGAGSPGNLAHELMHVLGFRHEGNAPEGNEDTVPWRIGNWVDEFARVGLSTVEEVSDAPPRNAGAR